MNPGMPQPSGSLSMEEMAARTAPPPGRVRDGARAKRVRLSPLETKGLGNARGVVARCNVVLIAEMRPKHSVDSVMCAMSVLHYAISTVIETEKGPIEVLDVNPGSSGCAGYL